MHSDPSPQFIVAVAVIIIKDGKFLAMKRSAKKLAGPNLWEALSGRVNHGEDPYNAAHREVLEESNLNVEIEKRPVDLYMSKRLGQPMLVIVYKAHYCSQEVVLSDEHSEYRWMTPKEFEELTTIERLAEAVHIAFES